MSDDYSAEAEAPEAEAPSAELVEKAKRYLSAVKEREHYFKTTWWKRADDSQKLYSQPSDQEGERYKSVYNILYSNTEVLLPSLYSATAKPDVRARFKDIKLKPIPEVIERFLTLFTDSAPPGGESFDSAVKDSVLSALTAAMGCVRLRLYEEREFPLQVQSVGYKNLIWGPAKKWARTPWVAFKHELTREEFAKQFNLSKEELASGYKSVSDDNASGEKSSCVVYEFWHKASREVFFLSEDWTDTLVLHTPDPLELRGFYPTPGPLMLTLKPNQLEPIPLYWFYQNQAEELNRITVRLNKVLSAIRVRGGYNSLMGEDFARILSDTELENALIPAADSAGLAQNGGFERNVWLLPIDKLIAVATQLYQAREAIKQVIYELTGISDIIRGSNVASETATATSTKDKWGTLRLRKMQTVVADYIRDVFRLAVDAGSQKLPADLWKRLVQLPIPTEQEQSLARQELQFRQQQAQERQMLAQQAQAMGQPPQEIPPPPQPDPAMQAAAQGPNMEEILARISSDVDRTFTINIQTSSTVDLDTAQDKSEVSEFMNSMGQMLAGLQPLMALGPTGLEAAKALLIAVCQRYKFGIPIVDILEQLQPPPPPPPPPPDPKAQAELQMLQMEAQNKERENAQKAQLDQAELEGKLRLMQAEQAMQEQEMRLKEREFALREREMLRKEELAQAQHQRALLTAAMPPATVPAKPGARNAPVRR